MALKKASSVDHTVFENLSKNSAQPQKEKMKTVSFQIRPSDYEDLRKIFSDLGLTIGSGLRFALTEFKRKHSE